MPIFNKLYIDFYFFIMAIYLLFNKGVAYTFGVEILLAFGLMLIFLNRKQFEIYKEQFNSTGPDNKNYNVIYSDLTESLTHKAQTLVDNNIPIPE